MRSRIVGALMLTAVMLLGSSAAESAEAEGKKCFEKRRRVSDLQAVGVSCPTARWVARRFDEKTTEEGHWPGDDPMMIGNFRCRNRQTGPETYRIRCRRAADEIVRFDWGV